MTGYLPSTTNKSMSEPTPYRVPILIALVVVIGGGAVLAFFLLDTRQRTATDGTRHPVNFEGNAPKERPVRFDPLQLGIGVSSVTGKLLAGADRLSPEKQAEIEREAKRLHQRREELSRAGLDSATLEAALTAEKDWHDAKRTHASRFAMLMPPTSETAPKMAVVEAIWREPGEFVALAEQIEKWLDATAGTSTADEIGPIRDALVTAIDVARDRRLAHLHEQAAAQIANGRYEQALAQFSPAMFPAELIPIPLWMLAPAGNDGDSDGDGATVDLEAVRREFYLARQLDCVGAIVLHHHGSRIDRAVAAEDAAAVVAAVQLDTALGTIFADLPAEAVATEIRRAADRALRPFEEKFVAMTNEAWAISPVSADELETALRKLRAVFLPVQNWGLSAYQERANTIVESVERRLLRRFPGSIRPE